MPLAFAASAGALLVLSGSPVNVIVSDALLDATGHRFGFFEFALVGVPLTVVTLAVSVLWGDRLLPRRTPGEQPADLSDHLSTVIDHYRLERGFFRTAVRRGSSLVDLRPDAVVPPEGVVLIGVQHDGGEPGAADEVVRPGDVLVLTGGEADVAAFVQANDLDVVATPLTRATREALLGREVGIAEVVIAPRSGLVGQRCSRAKFAAPASPCWACAAWDASAAPARRPSPRATCCCCTARGRPSRTSHATTRCSSSTTRGCCAGRPRRWARPPGAPSGCSAFSSCSSATGIVPPAVAGLIGAVGMVVTGVLTPQHAYRAVSWQTVVLIGGLIPLSVAISSSGAADLVRRTPGGPGGRGSPRLLLAALFVLTLALGQVVSNTATVLVVTPIAVAAAQDAGVGVAPMLMVVAVAGAASFLTPIATPANMIVMGPAGYRFGDYWKLGLITTLGWFVVAVGLVPVIWATG